VPLLVCLRRWLLSWLFPPSPQAAPGGSSPPEQRPPISRSLHAWAAFDQCDILAELDLLQLGESLRTAALEQGGYDNESFDVMVTIADVLVAKHGWSLQQSDGWLERMRLWDD
jgi:hypothetical protein